MVWPFQLMLEFAQMAVSMLVVISGFMLTLSVVVESQPLVPIELKI
jgi:hypothetical protein